ncbi:hypothetical protein [Telmatospirillum siberiense]|uniref:Uncharacterized protein n=1 Tax=Telmatospirillum siberiense TaxID=382514 RepID=A0A2N3PR09_9PROT|nr:hypothetical protein [Telmatospirillum siberiense]PKU22838.1 hypothetical protein CWS72_19480 [Telmatospirillum siberiense]
MAQSLSADDCIHFIGRPVRDFIGGMKPVTVSDFMDHRPAPKVPTPYRRACLASDPHAAGPQSQVDQLISDLMDIIVRAADNNGKAPTSESKETVEEVVALSMMQALLQKQVCSSF